MLSWINEKIDYLLQPALLRKENLKALPSGEYAPVPSDIVLPSIAIALLFVVLRHLFDRFVVYPIGHYFGLKDKTTYERVFDNPLLENQYRQSRNPKSDILTILSKKTGLEERQIQIWFRKRRKQDQITDLKKLSDSSWSFVFYFTMSWYGIYVLWNKPWVTQTKECWSEWPELTVSNDVYWYYLLELGYYISYVYMLFTDHKRKDFLEFFIHHNVTVILMMLSWSVNVVRIGTLVLCIHDPVDYILALGKSAVYCKKQVVADRLFVLFLPLWIVTRLVVYPYIVLYSVYVELPTLAENSSYLYILESMMVTHLLKALLVVLQVLHVIWTIHIIRSAANKITKGKLQDIRSDTEEGSDDEDNTLDENHLEVLNNNFDNNEMNKKTV